MRIIRALIETFARDFVVLFSLVTFGEKIRLESLVSQLIMWLGVLLLFIWIILPLFDYVKDFYEKEVKKK